MGPVMKMLGAGAVAMTLLIGTASAEDLTAASSRAIIERQLDAFERDDGEAAYALAAPTIKQMFGDADQFMTMVRDHYAPVYRHRSVEFGAFAESGDEATLNATLVDVYFRQFNGHTQVNATDLRSLNFPTRAELEKLGHGIAAPGMPQSELDALVEQELS